MTRDELIEKHKVLKDLSDEEIINLAIHYFEKEICSLTCYNISQYLKSKGITNYKKKTTSLEQNGPPEK